MRLLHPRPVRRAGFTLIEVMVVIAIIAVLAGLLTAAVINLFSKGPALVDRDTVLQLNGAAQRFFGDNKCYPPSKLFLANSRSRYNANNALHKMSLEYLNTMFPRLTLPQNPTAAFDWSGGLATGALNTGVTLQGDQALIFCIGGIPTRDAAGNFGCLGFNKASGFSNPTTPGGERAIWFQGFDTTRLYQRVAGNPFLSYKNAWAVQNNVANSTYAYFSSYKGQGYAFISSQTAGNPSDCAGLGVAPYYKTTTPTTQYYNPTTCQIISAGADGHFGTGGLWTPANAPNQAGVNGKDDISNFYDNILGATP